MHKFCCIAIAVSLSLASISVFAETKVDNESLLILAPESQHAASTKRITAQFTRAHYKKIKIDDLLSEQIFDRYIKQLDYARNVFLAADVKGFEQYRDEFDTVIARGKLDVAYEIYNLNLQRRLERYQYALSLLASEKPFDFDLDESYDFDREDAQWPNSVDELDELWRKKVKYDALNLTLAGKEWEKIQEVLGKRYRYAIKRLKQSESEDVFQVVMNSFARVVEPHTSYLSPRNAERFQMEMNLSLEGIGAVLRAEEDYTVIQSVVSGGPADKSNELNPKDRIVGVAQDDKEFVDVIGWRLDDVVELIKGPKGSKVRLQVLGAESEDDSSIKVVSIVRDTIKLEDRAAKSEVYFEKEGDENTKKLGVITIPSFYNHLSRDVKLEIAKLKEENVAGIIVDLRGNGGGSLTEATLLTGLFIDKGPVVQVRDGANRVQVNSDKDGISFYDGPLTVMVDRYSASASEIFSAAIQDYGRGIIVGEHTFGKGTVQQHRGLGRVYDLYEKPFGSIQFTIAKFYRINGGSTQHRGVLPDIEFPSAIDPADWGESKEENALPWDQIPKAQYNKLDDISKDVSYLTSLYSSRVEKNQEFNYLLSDIAEYKAEKDDKNISLNLAKRKEKRESRKAKQLKRANERLTVMGKENVADLDDLPEDLEALDPFLDETARITFDLVSLGKVAKK
ncbi:carboxy terminal-processing peptidase [Colwellia sp. MB02u-18]|uniref:carboxy terminal-processing peptidase n=1 Tax=unclassified Colwellia TaxID=196834 RepID=UPI0015F6A692|nr:MULTISPECIES: carboxy terminal-processing peptidase [unclassified Colwellia]MBA6224966.1 carboxy terminal-processing peptidase [Colwellia sp. MB3u-45]MBA6268746.1 carboxy terminal-processing peptidase [Colwellia sp. MB3u-43]MBA6321177.1 carboxy terminal-processing peptidase [Colwellia sp. MB02u-19]MBA6325730.1 carboxy terminal-processing peptidase [Colwellia sp. MB02u-18]MBA6332205.1 carboxy terminal-processing peptidase [Colwellia sp. MB02u-12]